MHMTSKITLETHNGEHHVYSALESTPELAVVTSHTPTMSPSALKETASPADLGPSCLSLSPPPPQLKVNPRSSDSHVFLGLGGEAG